MRANKKLLLALVFSGLPLLYTVPLWYGGVLGQVENWLVDIRYRYFNPNHKLSDKIVVLDLDENTFRVYRHNKNYGPWPWPRKSYLNVIEYVNQLPPRMILFDIFFTNFSPDDKEMVKLNENVPSVSHAIQFERSQFPEKTPIPHSLRRHAIQVSGSERLFHWQEASFPTPLIASNAFSVHSVSFKPDQDGISRRLQHFFHYQDAVFPSLALRAFSGGSPISGTVSGSEIHIKTNGREVTIPALASSRLGREYQGEVPLHYYSCDALRRFELQSRIAAGGVIESRRALDAGEVADFSQLKVQPEVFQDKFVIVGVSAPSAYDIKKTVCGDMPGFMLHVVALSNLLNGDFLIPWPRWTGLLAALILLPFTTWLVVMSKRTVVRVVLPAAVFGTFVVGALLLFKLDRLVWMAPSVVSVPVAFLAALGYLSVIEGRERSRFHAAMGKYLSPEVLEEVMSKGALRAEVGERRNISVLFSDIRGFTTISEKQDAAGVVGILNEYFSVMVSIIFHRNGTLDKFIGDAIMAFWGAPVFRGDHAVLAVRAALEMAAALKELNASFQARGIDALAIGIGLNTGEMIVGNIGSDQRLDYTIIGDNVNLGSRLEGLTKQYGLEVLISESTYQALGGALPCRVIDLVAVKGKSIPVPVYEPLADPSPYGALSAAEASLRFQSAFAAYRARSWEEALAIYGEMDAMRSGGDVAARLLMERIRLFQEQPPPPGWDGSLVMKTK